MSEKSNRLSLDAIIIGKRHRHALGDIASLAKSIEQVGLLQPLVVTPDNKLVAGQRRLEAVRELKWPDVPVHIVETVDDALKLLQAERDENTCRKDLTPGEAVTIGKELEKLERKGAGERRAQAPGKPQGTKKVSSGNLPEETKGETRDKVGAAVGMSGRTYQKAKAVVDAAEANPEKHAETLKEMDATGKVDPAFKKVKASRKTRKSAPRVEKIKRLVKALQVLVDEGRLPVILAYPLAKLDKDQQRQLAAAGIEAVRDRGFELRWVSSCELSLYLTPERIAQKHSERVSRDECVTWDPVRASTLAREAVLAHLTEKREQVDALIQAIKDLPSPTIG